MRHVGQDRGLEERAAERMALAAGGDPRTLGDGVGDALFDLANGVFVDQGALNDAFMHAVADLQP